MIKRVFVLILILLLALFSGYFIYKSFDEYSNYLTIKNIDKNLKNFEEMDRLLTKIENELSLSSIYIASGGKSDFNSLQIARDNSDNMIENALFLKDKVKLKNDLRYARSRVDVISLDYKSIIFDYYQDEIAKTVINDMKQSAKELFLEFNDLKSYIDSYIKLSELKNSLNQEKSFITYILKQSKKMDKDDLVIWDRMIEYQESFTINSIDNDLNKEVKRYLNRVDIKDKIFENRVKVALGATKGEYSLSSNDWLKDQERAIDIVQHAKSVVYEHLKEELTKIISTPEKIIIYVAITLILILILFILIYKLAEKDYEKKSIQISNDVLRARH